MARLLGDVDRLLKKCEILNLITIIAFINIFARCESIFSEIEDMVPNSYELNNGHKKAGERPRLCDFER